MGRRVLLLVMIAGCQPVARPTDGPPVAKTPAEPPASAPKVDVTVHNMGPRECKVAVWAGTGMPTSDVPGTVLPIRTTTIAMAKDEHLAVQNPDGKYSTMGSTEGTPGEIVVHGNCRSIAVAEEFSAQQLASMSQHVIATCCASCDERGCTGCSEPESGAKCGGKQATEGKCAVFDDVLDCVPATAVDADGSVEGEYAFRRLSAPAK